MKDMRVKKLKQLIADHGTQELLAAALETTPGYISQMKNGIRPITEKTARSYESKLNLGDGWFDMPGMPEMTPDKGMSSQEPLEVYTSLYSRGNSKPTPIGREIKNRKAATLLQQLLNINIEKGIKKHDEALLQYLIDRY